MARNLCSNLFTKEIFYKYFRLKPILLIFLLINQQIYASNDDDISQTANLENLIDNYYNVYLSNSVVDKHMSYYSFFQPKTANSTENIWTGMLIAFFIDDSGNLREDSNNNLHLDSADAIVNLSYDLTTNNIKITKSSLNNKVFNIENYSIDNLSTVWNTDKLATDDISKLGFKDHHIKSSEKRYIFTQISQNTKTLVNSICNLNHQYFNLDILSCYNLINYLYGKTNSTQRSKTKYVSATDKKISNLGDIVHSELIVAGHPKENYDFLYNDMGYAEFKALYKNRRKVVYVGANDGMVHAFNAGFYSLNDNSLSVTGTNNEVAHALGSELWADAPLNLLPHLKDLTAKSYRHKYFVDGSLQIVDAQIFPSDKYHPNGWGTILIVATGLGGDVKTLTIGNQIQDFSSSYILIDITNPEIAPEVIAEIRHKQLGFTLAKPAIVKLKRKISDNSSTTNSNQHDWYLVFASGLANNLIPSSTDNYLKIVI